MFYTQFFLSLIPMYPLFLVYAFTSFLLNYLWYIFFALWKTYRRLKQNKMLSLLLLLFSYEYDRPVLSGRSSELPRGSVPPTCTHMIVRGRRTQGPPSLRRRWKSAARGRSAGWSAPGASPLPPPLLPLPLPLVQADGTKSIMYKDVKRNGSEMPDGVRMNGEGGGGLAGGRGEEEQWARGTVEEGKRRWEPKQKRRGEATRKDRRLRSTGEMNPARIVPAPYNVQSSRAGFSRRAIRYDAMQCYSTPVHSYRRINSRYCAE